MSSSADEFPRDEPPEPADVVSRRLLIAAVLALLPTSMRLWLGRRLLGWEVHPTARIGRSLVAARHVRLGPGASIGNLNIIKGLEVLSLGDNAIIGVLNWITGPPRCAPSFQHSPNRYPALILGEGASVSSRHHFDCTDAITVGDFSTVGGNRTTIYTHSVDLVRVRQKASPVEIGERSAVLTHCVLLSGVRVPSRSIISAGSVVNTTLTKECVFYSGVPAVEVRELPPTLGYFTRTQGWID